MYLQKCDVANERHVLFLQEQKIYENIDSYVTDLEDLASSCELRYHVRYQVTQVISLFA